MAQFDVHKNKNPRTRKIYPFLLDVQSDLLGDLRTRVVVPLAKHDAMRGSELEKLTPVVEIDGQEYVALTPQLAGVPVSAIGAVVANLVGNRDEIVSALDFLVTGV